MVKTSRCVREQHPDIRAMRRTTTRFLVQVPRNDTFAVSKYSSRSMEQPGALPDDDALLRWKIHGIGWLDAKRLEETVHVPSRLHCAHRGRGVLVGEHLGP